jgi:hypothetical protein
VLIQSLSDGFDLSEDIIVSTPAIPGTVLTICVLDITFDEQRNYCKGIGKLIYLMRWS